MSDLTDKYLTEKIKTAGYVQEIDVGMRSLLDKMFKEVTDLHKHLKKYKREKDIRPFASGVRSLTQAFSMKFKDWKGEVERILHEV